MVERKRYIQRKFRVTPEENQDIKSKMKVAGLRNFSNYARLMTLTGKVVVVNYDGLIELRKEINSIGVNINQIAKVANTDEHVSIEQVVTLLSEMKRIEDLLAEITDKNIMRVEEYDGLHESISD
ncbi:plasmid mobilization protein [Streptococcus suis]|uniref:plasmid mobilization protein n=1 Tax=Streptococcus suis TaxID=1307 RepID=UPI0004256E90|nr:plasmid mobilization relaxosome protein MobC [Streptococcus suis]HEM3180821.1 plasmid mobilization relaxosome protein MobC [Streptococcus suis 92-4172]